MLKKFVFFDPHFSIPDLQTFFFFRTNIWMWSWSIDNQSPGSDDRQRHDGEILICRTIGLSGELPIDANLRQKNSNMDKSPAGTGRGIRFATCLRRPQAAHLHSLTSTENVSFFKNSSPHNPLNGGPLAIFERHSL